MTWCHNFFVQDDDMKLKKSATSMHSHFIHDGSFIGTILKIVGLISIRLLIHERTICCWTSSLIGDNSYITLDWYMNNFWLDIGLSYWTLTDKYHIMTVCAISLYIIVCNIPVLFNWLNNKFLLSYIKRCWLFAGVGYPRLNIVD